jgi:biotin carboxyl carrier protein
MFKVSGYNQEFEIELGLNSEGKINGTPFKIDPQPQGAKAFHVLSNNKGYNIEVIDANYDEKSITLLVNGNKYPLSVKDEFDLLLDKLGMSSMNDTKINEIKAPMPGLVLDVKVNIGDTVEKGDSILVLEAMKMENVLKSPAEGVVKSIHINKGDAVEKNHLLISFE